MQELVPSCVHRADSPSLLKRVFSLATAVDRLCCVTGLLQVLVLVSPTQVLQRLSPQLDFFWCSSL